MRFIQIIYKEERWKTYGVAVYMLGILFFYGIEYFYYQNNQQLLWLSLNTSVGRLVKHPYIYLFLIVDVLPILALFLLSQQQFEKYFKWCVYFFIIPIDLYYFWEIGLPLNILCFNLSSLSLYRKTAKI